MNTSDPKYIVQATLSKGPCIEQQLIDAVAMRAALGPPKEQPEYRGWSAMKERCERVANNRYAIYGARGIKVCERWRASFWAFLSDMGRRPGRGYTIDRIDNDKGYSPENCRWASRYVQCRNKRTNWYLTAFGETKIIQDWARDPRCMVKRLTLRYRLVNSVGWTTEAAMTTPAGGHK